MCVCVWGGEGCRCVYEHLYVFVHVCVSLRTFYELCTYTLLTPITSVEISMRLIWCQVKRLSWLELQVVEEEHTEASNITWKLTIESKNK